MDEARRLDPPPRLAARDPENLTRFVCRLTNRHSASSSLAQFL
jgi:hypothetical protein